MGVKGLVFEDTPVGEFRRLGGVSYSHLFSEWVLVSQCPDNKKLKSES